jgi:O-antigen/teichoic acid export membrane protein
MDDQQTVAETPPTAARPRQFRRGLLMTASSTGIVVVSLFAETMIAARALSTTDYGIYVLMLAVVYFFVTAVDFGFKAAVTQMIASSDRDEQVALANMAILARVVVVALVALVIWLVRDVLLLFDTTGSLLRMAFYVPVMLAVLSFDELLLSILQGFQVYQRLAIAQVTRTLLRLILSATFLLVLHEGVQGLIYSWIIAYGLGVIYEFFAVPIPKRIVFRKTLFVDLLRFGLPLQGNRFLWFLFDRIDVLLLGTLAGPMGVAYYSVANKVPDALQRLADSFIAVYYPTVSALLSTKRNLQAHWYLNHSLRLVAFLTALATLVAVVFGKEIVLLLFSDKYLIAVPAFGLLMLAFHLMLTVNLLGYTLTAAKHPGKSLGANVLLTSTQVIGNWFLIPFLDFLGPAVVGNLSACLNMPLNIWLLRRIGIRVAASSIVKQTGLLLIFGGLTWWLQPQSFVLRIGIVLVYLAACVLLNTISVEDLSLIVPEKILRRRVVLPAEPAGEGSFAEGRVGP